jgi:hypothetical protein
VTLVYLASTVPSVGAHFLFHCARGRSRSPASHSSNLAVLVIALQSLASMRREEPHREHCSSRGKLSAETTPMWPHGQTTLTIMGV